MPLDIFLSKHSLLHPYRAKSIATLPYQSLQSFFQYVANQLFNETRGAIVPLGDISLMTMIYNHFFLLHN